MTSDQEKALREPASASGEVVTVPRERLQYASDLLAERAFGNPARSCGHNARVVIDALLAAAPEAAKPATDTEHPYSPEMTAELEQGYGNWFDPAEGAPDTGGEHIAGAGE